MVAPCQMCARCVGKVMELAHDWPTQLARAAPVSAAVLGGPVAEPDQSRGGLPWPAGRLPRQSFRNMPNTPPFFVTFCEAG